MKDRLDKEFGELSQQTGVPPDEIPEALQTFDELFPAGDSWLTDLTGTNFRLLKMVPVQFRGIGAFHRLNLYGVEKFGDLGYTDYTAKDLSRWNNAGAKLLASS